jgi:WD40 repeat protein
MQRLLLILLCGFVSSCSQGKIANAPEQKTEPTVYWPSKAEQDANSENSLLAFLIKDDMVVRHTGKRLYAAQPEALPDKLVDHIDSPRFNQPGGIASIAVSPDGRWMATGDRSATNRVNVWDLKNGKAKWILHGHASWIARLQFSPDSKYIFASHDDDTFTHSEAGELVIWNVKSGQVAGYYQSRVWCLADDGKTLVISQGWGKGLSVDLFDFPRQRPICNILHPHKPINSVALSSDGSFLAIGTDKQIDIWETASSKVLRSIPNLKEVVHLLRFSPDTNVLASVSDDFLSAGSRRQVELWEPKTGNKLGVLSFTEGWPLRYLEFLPDKLLLTNRPGEYEVWSLDTHRSQARFKAGALAVFDGGKSVVHNSNATDSASSHLFFEDLFSGVPLPMKGFSLR